MGDEAENDDHAGAKRRPGPNTDNARTERLAAALRENLRRRKEQARARGPGKASKKDRGGA